MKEYKLLVSEKIMGDKGIEELVSKHMNEGWKPIGGIAISKYLFGFITFFHQSMVRE